MDPKERQTRKTKKAGVSLGFGRINYILMAVGLGMIVVGFIFLAFGDITIAPILLVIGYCAVLPVAILISKKSKKAALPPDTIEKGSTTDS